MLGLSVMSCDSIDCSLPGSSVHAISQARILESVAMPFSRGSSWPRYQTRVSCIAGRFFTVWVSEKACAKALWFTEPEEASAWAELLGGREKTGPQAEFQAKWELWVLCSQPSKGSKKRVGCSCMYFPSLWAGSWEGAEMNLLHLPSRSKWSMEKFVKWLLLGL